jgi:hypothetical protein
MICIGVLVHFSPGGKGLEDFKIQRLGLVLNWRCGSLASVFIATLLFASALLYEKLCPLRLGRPFVLARGYSDKVFSAPLQKTNKFICSSGWRSQLSSLSAVFLVRQQCDAGECPSASEESYPAREDK